MYTSTDHISSVHQTIKQHMENIISFTGAKALVILATDIKKHMVLSSFFYYFYQIDEGIIAKVITLGYQS
jgi:hypothetical protein